MKIFRVGSGLGVVAKGVIFVMCLWMGSGWTLAQPGKEPLIKRMLAATAFDTLHEAGKPKVVGYPTLAFSPETSWEVGISVAYLYYAKRNPQVNRLSRIHPFVFYTLKKQYGLWLDYEIYTDQNRWYLHGRGRFQDFPQLYYGIGPETQEEQAVTVDARAFIFRQRVMYQFSKNWFFGPEFDFVSMQKVGFIRGDTLVPQTELPLGGKGVSNLGVGLTVEYDSRNNQLNVRKGLFAALSVLAYQRAFGSDLDFQNILLDIRHYANPFHPRQVWASQLFGSLSFGDVPFNQLSQMGGESLMRGYYMGRFRDRSFLAAQTEYRFLPFPFSKRLGGVAFLAAGAVAPRAGDMFKLAPKLSGGAGIRFLVFPNEDIFARFDVGFTGEGRGFYLFLGEAF